MVVFMIMASQFKSLRLPFVMLFTIPVSLVGIVLALMAAGQGFSITALMGILMVVGIAVSNGILLVDDANRRFSEGAEKVEAIIAAARSRFVPIAMTSLATVIGLIPTALGLETGTEANQPLALAVVGGLTSSTRPVAVPRAGDVPLLREAKRRRRRGARRSLRPSGRRTHDPKATGGPRRFRASRGVFAAAVEIARRFDATLVPFRAIHIPPEFPPAAHVTARGSAPITSSRQSRRSSRFSRTLA